jgi:hypothetical protein
VCFDTETPYTAEWSDNRGDIKDGFVSEPVVESVCLRVQQWINCDEFSPFFLLTAKTAAQDDIK